MSLVLTRRRAAAVVAGALAGTALALPAAPAHAATPTATVTVLSTNASGVTIRTQGTGFSAVTNAGDAGVYVGLAPAGTMPDVSTRAGMDAFAAADWVTPARMVDGSFTSTITAPPERLDRTKTYAIYTWQAHTHSNTTQDTQTPVAIDFSQLPAPTPAKTTPTVTPTWKVKPTAAKKGQLSVAVSGGATGAVSVLMALKGSKKTKTKAGTLASGVALVTLPKLAAGKWTFTVSYAGDSLHNAAQAAALSAKVKPKKKVKK